MTNEQKYLNKKIINLLTLASFSYNLLISETRRIMPHLVYDDILIDERVFVMSGKYTGARGAVCGKTPTMIRVRFDEHTAGELVGNTRASMLCHIFVEPAAKPEGKADTKANPKSKRYTTPIDEKEMRKLWSSPELQQLGGLLARLGIDPTKSRPLKVCLERSYKLSCRSLEQEMESTWGSKAPSSDKCKSEPT